MTKPKYEIGTLFRDTDEVFNQNEGILIVLSRVKNYSRLYKLYSFTKKIIIEHSEDVINEYYETF